MKVWIILAHDYEDVYIDSVWTTKAGAKARAAQREEAQQGRLQSFIFDTKGPFTVRRQRRPV